MRYIMFVLFAGVLALPAIVSAQAGGLVPCSGPDCTTEDVTALVAGVISFLISMLGVIAVIAMVYAGFKMVISQGNESEWKNAKSILSNVIIGIIIILAAWLIVDTVMRGLTGEGLEYWSNFNR